LAVKKLSVEYIANIGIIVGLLASAVFAAALKAHEVGSPILVLIASCFVSYNTWAFKSGRSMYFGIGASAPDAGSAPRLFKLVGMWIIYIGFLAEEMHSLMQVEGIL